MKPYQREFIEFALANNVLKFGEFKLKSGRMSPYFFNMGAFSTGATISRLGRFYAEIIQDEKIHYDVLFGPAYKGIPLVTSVAVALSEHHAVNKPYCFNRKEIKDHGEGGNVIGASLAGKKVLIVDDVISAGTAINNSVHLIEENQGELVGIIIGIDRQERGQTELSAIQEVEKKYCTRVTSIIKLEQILEFLQTQTGMEKELQKMKTYLSQYGMVSFNM